MISRPLVPYADTLNTWSFVLPITATHPRYALEKSHPIYINHMIFITILLQPQCSSN